MNYTKSKFDSFKKNAIKKQQLLFIMGGNTATTGITGNGTGTASNSGHSTGGEFGGSSIETSPTTPSSSNTVVTEPIEPKIKYGSNYEIP